MADRETQCGLGPWRPKFMQFFASKKVYMFFYGMIGIIKGMQYTYLSAMLSTLERKFGIKSKETAYLMSGNEIAQILFLFFLPITMKVKKRPFWCSKKHQLKKCFDAKTSHIADITIRLIFTFATVSH